MQYTKPFVSVVIPTFNRSAMLSRCLDSLFTQSYPENMYEIIVVNGSSKDNSERILAEYEKKAPCGFSWITLEGQKVTDARNSGIFRSKGDLICFIDDDCIADSNWISNLINGFTNETIGAVGGNIVSYQVKTPLQQYTEDAKILSQDLFMSKNKLITANAAYRRQILTTISGFDNYFIACEDADVAIRTQLLGYELRYIPDAIVFHDHRSTIIGLFLQQYRNGKGFVQLHRKYGIKYNLAYNISIFEFRNLVILIRYPFTLVSSLLSKKNKNFVLKPLFEVIRSSALDLGIIRETFFGDAYEGMRAQTHIDFIEFMDDKPLFSLWEKLRKKVHDREY